jgi:DNA-binding MarR family transcriptional regulator
VSDERPSIADLPLGWLFGVVGRLVTASASREMERHGVSPTGFLVLMSLYRRDGMRSTDMARLINCTPATLSTVAGTLERNGYLERRGHPDDRRVVQLHLTGTGRRHAGEVWREVSTWYGEMFDHITPEEEPVVRRILLRTLARFRPPAGADGEWLAHRRELMENLLHSQREGSTIPRAPRPEPTTPSQETDRHDRNTGAAANTGHPDGTR